MRTKQDGVTSQKTVISRRNSRESLTSTVTLLVLVTVYIPATSCVRITTLPTAEAIWRQVTGRGEIGIVHWFAWKAQEHLAVGEPVLWAEV